MLPSIRLIMFAFLVLTLSPGGTLRLGAAESEYKMTSPDLYLRAAVLKANPRAVILKAKKVRRAGDSYFITHAGKPASEVYVETTRDWLEPVTPPDMPASLGVAPNVMQIREPQGDVQVAPPEGPDNFGPATEGMPIVNGTVVRTGNDGTAAVLFGGINSARLAPNSVMMVQQTVTAALRTTRIVLRSGMLFSKVGLSKGARQDYQVSTPHASVAVKGTDFACVVLPDRTEVYLAQGTVQFSQPGGQKIATMHATGTGELKFARYPQIEDARRASEATSETVTSLFNFIPKVDLKIKTLRNQVTQGIKLNPAETKYLGLIKEIPCLEKLELVAPPVVAAIAPTPPKAAAPPSTASPVAPLPPSVHAPSVPNPNPAPVTSAPPVDVPISHGPGDTVP